MKYPTIHTNQIPIYHESGALLSKIILPEAITPSITRRGGYSDRGIYYKGAGIIYRGHMTNEPKASEKILQQSTLPYQKYTVIQPALVKRFGIFMFPHQPIFSDCEGACGKKEQKLIENQKNFQYSAISEIIDIYETGIPEHHIYAYRLRDLTSKPEDILLLFEYILNENYNSAWDKNLWGDIAGFCYVRDLADWFVSDQLCHKLGTIYALLHSIYQADKYIYANITNAILGYQHMDIFYLPYISACIVKHFLPNAFSSFPYDLADLTPELFSALWELLCQGKACCHLEDDKKWDWVRDYYRKEIPGKLTMFQQDMTLSNVRYQEIASLS